jgi:hypothetical protein
MRTISITYTVKYELDFAPEYVWVDDKLCFNSKTGRKIKQVYKNGMIGYNIKGKFYSLTRLRKHLVKPEITKLPF